MDILNLLDEIQALARSGLYYSSNSYDQERYERLLGLATRSYGDLLQLPQEDIAERFSAELGSITPKVGADAAIFNAQGEILLMERADGSGWCLPCGWVEAHERPVDAAIREAREETGLEVAAKRLVGVFTRKASITNGPHTMISVVHWCEITGGALTLSQEGLALEFWPIEKMNEWHANHELYARAAHEMWQSSRLLPAVSQ